MAAVTPVVETTLQHVKVACERGKHQQELNEKIKQEGSDSTLEEHVRYMALPSVLYFSRMTLVIKCHCWKTMYQNQKDIIPNLIILAELALLLPIHTADCERSFNKKKLIKSKSKKRIRATALNNLMLISIIEGKPLEEFDFVDSLPMWKAQKDRRISTRHS